MRARSSDLTKRLSAELEQAWMAFADQERELKAVHDQARRLRETLADEIQRRLQLQDGNGQETHTAQTRAAAELHAQMRRDRNEISQLKESLQALGEALDAANHRIMELSNQQQVVRGERPHLVSDNDAPISNLSA